MKKRSSQEGMGTLDRVKEAHKRLDELVKKATESKLWGRVEVSLLFRDGRPVTLKEVFEATR